MEKLEKRCVALYSGGLDSLLATVIMKKLGFEVLPLFVRTPFYKKDEQSMRKQLKPFGLDLYVKENNKAYIDTLTNPRFGYGKNINPCIDCKIFFYKMAKEFMEEKGALFLVTGEVLGQRPMSQRSYTVLRTIEKHAGLVDWVLRPLSAKCLPETKMEKMGLIEKEKLYCITGRSRKAQFELAKEFGIENYESPAGGCILTDQAFAIKLKELFKYPEELYDKASLELLYIGRHFRINGIKFVVSRNEQESKRLLDEFDLPKIICTDSPCAVGVFTKKPDQETLNIAARIFKRYSKKAKTIAFKNEEMRIIGVYQMADDELISKYRIGG